MSSNTPNTNNNNLLDLSKYNIQSDNMIYKNLEANKEENELKNLRLENSLSLRKKKLNEIIFSRRTKEAVKQNNNNEYEDDIYDIYFDYEDIKKNVPSLILEEFPTYEDKLSIIHQFLNNDFTLLHGIDFNEDYLKLFSLYQLTELSYSEKTDIYDKNFENELKLVFYDIMKLINENNNKKIIFGMTAVLVNFIFSSKVIVQEFKKCNIWKRLADFSELKIPDINDNIAIIMKNYYMGNKSVGKEYILSGFSRYIKQILINFFKTFIEESKKENVPLIVYLSGISIIKDLIKYENNEVNKNNDFDIIVKMRFIYDYITKVFLIASSWIINNVKSPKHDSIFKFISDLLELFSLIASYVDEELYEMQEFRGEAFVSSFCSLLKFLILGKEKEAHTELILDVIEKLYNFLGILFNIGSEKTEIYVRNKILIITEEFIKNIYSMKSDLINKIIFFLSNYADNEFRVKEIFEDSIIFTILKEYVNKNINHRKICYNFYFLLENGFKVGENNIKEIIIKNCSNFLIERIKILYEFIVHKNETANIKMLVEKCHLLFSFVHYLRNNTYNLQMLKELLDLIRISNLEEFIENIQIFLNEKKDKEIIEGFLKALKK